MKMLYKKGPGLFKCENDTLLSCEVVGFKDQTRQDRWIVEFKVATLAACGQLFCGERVVSTGTQVHKSLLPI